ncbi:MAG: PSD1 and planctomycete cytochrome C domain-containing protein [Bryobacteraceae bacterium]
MKRALGLLLTLAVACSADEFFEKKIRPVLVEQCYACHSAQSKTPMGGLRLDSMGALLKGGDTGPAVKPGDKNSLLLRAISYRDLNLKMPPGGKLSDERIADFTRWVEAGAPGPTQVAAPAAASSAGLDLERARSFWAFQPLPPPDPKRTIDSFLRAKLKENGLDLAPAADRGVWIRRVSFSLIGLPPSPREVNDFVNDQAPDAYRKVVERLLASPHYGERWTRHWLDLVRFSETNGHEFDNDKLDAWRYRDYVIRALNQDVPYDQFVREHIAGDLMPNPRLTPDGAALESPLGTSVYWFGEVLNSATDSVKSRADQVDNQLDVVSKAFLGLTVACARCHDHKFDPIPTLDYYSMAGYLHSTALRYAVIDSPARAREIAAAHAGIAAHNESIRKLLASSLPVRSDAAPTIREGDELFAEFDSYDGWDLTGEAFRPGPRREVPPNQPLKGYTGESIASSFGAGTDRLVGSVTSKKFIMPKLWVHVRLAGTKTGLALRERAPLRVTVVADDHPSQHFFPDGSPGFTWKSIRMTKEIGRTCYIEIVDRDRGGHIVVDKIVFSDSKEPPADPPIPENAPIRLEDINPTLVSDLQARRAAIEAQFPHSAWGMIAGDEDPHDVSVHIRGSHKNLGVPAPRRPLQILTKTVPKCEGSGRLGLAQWMTTDAAPLVARVMVNRIWRHHFGRGLVPTTDNFGKTGERPSHPELLDWLAARFVESGWSVKAMHRLMLNTEAYRQSSRVEATASQIDPQNHLLHHMPVHRLEGEAIRDALLNISGSLNRDMYGRGVRPHIGKYQDGRGKPASGPLDGDNRRSIYIQVRRNFLTPMFLAFDYPLPVSTIGARTSSTVPSQALMMMNNEFAAEMAKRWAGKVAAEEADPVQRVEMLYRAAYARLPEDWERREAIAFAEKRSWQDLAHVLINSAEFIYVP